MTSAMIIAMYKGSAMLYQCSTCDRTNAYCKGLTFLHITADRKYTRLGCQYAGDVLLEDVQQTRERNRVQQVYGMSYYPFFLSSFFVHHNQIHAIISENCLLMKIVKWYM